MPSESLASLDPETADARGEASVEHIRTIYSNRRIFPFIQQITTIARFSELDGQGVDIVADLESNHPLTQSLDSSILYIQSKSMDLNVINFLKARRANGQLEQPARQPLVAINGQRPEVDVIGDTYTQLLLYMGLLHNCYELQFPNLWQPEIEGLLDTCGDEAKQITLDQLNQGIFRRNRGVNRELAAIDPYFFSRRDETLQRLTRILPTYQ